MERELRLKAFMEEYARIVQLFDDIVSMKDSMGRLEKYMIIMVCQVMVALMGNDNAESTSWSTDSSGVRLVACRSLRPPIRRSTRAPSRSGYEPIGEPEVEKEEEEKERDGSVPSLVSGPSTFLHFPVSPANSLHSLQDDAEESDEDPTITPPNWRHSSSSSHTLSTSTPILAPRRSNSFSSIPTIDRTISEDSMLVIKRL